MGDLQMLPLSEDCQSVPIELIFRKSNVKTQNLVAYDTVKTGEHSLTAK